VIEVEDFEKKYFQNNKINILSIGKYVKRKDHLTLLKAVNKLKDKYDLSVTLLGERVDEAVLKELEDYVADNDLRGIVSIESDLDHKDIVDKYRAHDIFVLPSYDEPAAYSPVEAMAAKLPVICSDTNGTKCYVKKEENGYIFKSRDYKDLAKKLSNLTSSRDRLSKMGENSFRKAQKEHSKDIFLKFFNEILRS
jgi:glycosyltransferase involved in cell wall biosynthesis